MFGYDSKLKLKELLLFVAEQELAIEKMRQILAAIRDFEPYAAFKRIDRNGTGYISTKEICQFERENGYREVSPEDFIFMINYFDLDGDGQLNYHDFLQVLLPCDNPFLRSAATQRPNQELYPNEFLPMRVERAMSQLIYKEVTMHLKAENIKRSLETSYDFSVRAAFKAVDDWNYNYIDKQNLKRFLRSMGHLASKQEIVAILRRFDLDGDAKINMSEFGEAIKTQLAASKPVKLRNEALEAERARSASNVGKKMSRSKSNNRRNQGSSMYGESPRMDGGTPNHQSRGSSMYGGPASILKSGRKEKKKRPTTADRVRSSYNPNRGVKGGFQRAERSPSVGKGGFMANAGMSHSPYQVQNVARIPGGGTASQYGADKQVTFAGGRRKPAELPTDLNSGMGYLKDLRRSGQSPLRNQSPRRNDANLSTSYNRLPAQQQQDIGIGRNSASPLRSSSPGRGPTSGLQAEILPRNAGFGNYDRIEQSEFAKVLKENIFLERELEGAKIEVALKPDFNLLDAFKIFDTRGTGNISVQDIIMSLRDNLGFDQFTHDDVYLLFRRHDSNNDGKLNFTEFSNLILPVSKEYAALLTDRPDFYMSRSVPPSQFFNADTRQEFRALWASMFKCERACEVLRQSLRQRPYFNIKQAFTYMDRDGDGYVTLEDLREFLSNNGFFATERELQGVMQKCDKDGDNRISFSEFVDELSPKLGY